MMREIGGYFEWEMAYGCSELHTENTLVLKNGRSCLALLLRRERPKIVWVPYYICDGALEPLRRNAVEIRFYGLDEDLEIAGNLPELSKHDRLVYVDYFGLKSDYVQRLEEQYQENLWVDQVQAFFQLPGEKSAYRFNSARKFFGVPDGAYLYFPESVEVTTAEDLGLSANNDYHLEHLTKRLEGKTLEGLSVFQKNEQNGSGKIALVSSIGRAMLQRIDYSRTATVRQRNYRHLHSALGQNNRISPRILDLKPGAVPFCYPFLPGSPMDKQYFWDRRIYVPNYWKECDTRLAEGYLMEKELSAGLLPLPVDQRHDEDDMDRLVEAVRAYPDRSP